MNGQHDRDGCGGGAGSNWEWIGYWNEGDMSRRVPIYVLGDWVFNLYLSLPS